MSAVKALLRRLLRAAGVRVVRNSHPAAAYVDHVPDSPFDFLVLRLFPDPRGLRFLQIGAHDGRRNDPLHRWITTCDWTGIMVEPMPDFAERVRALHRRRTGIEVLTCAIAGVSGDAVLYRVDPNQPDLPNWAEGIATLDADRAAEAARALGLSLSDLKRETVRTITMPELLERFPAASPEVVVIDTEGYDIKLATALLETGCRPRLLHFEHACASSDERWRFVQHLHSLGYETVSYGPDTTAFLRR